MSADIEPLHNKGDKGWGAKAAAGDALGRVPNEAPFIACWLELDSKGDQVMKWSKANMGFQQYSFMAVALMEFAQSCVRQSMERTK
jgi:hypothetical protein